MLFRWLMSKLGVEKVEVPQNSLGARVFPRLNYADAYRIKTTSGLAIEDIAAAIFYSSPAWVGFLMKLRDRIVSLAGLKTTPHSSKITNRKVSFEPGNRIGIFRVYNCSDNEILMGEDDTHLDFRVSVLLQPEQNYTWVVVSTLVRFNNWLGKLYFLPVSFFHRLVVIAMLRQGRQKLTAQA